MVAALVVRPVPEPDAWPKYLPPFLPKAVSFAADGMLWVRRTTPAGSPPLYDVIDRRGVLAGRLTMPARTLLLAHGDGVVYLARLDDDDLQYLGRYPLPEGYRQAAGSH
jgi:hypothetical protein